MDVQADQAGLKADPADPFATAVVPRSDTGAQRTTGATGAGGAQGQLFHDAYPTYADTDQIPAMGHGSGAAYQRRRTSRLLRLAVAVVALAVVAGGVALGLVQAGVIGTSNNGHSASAPPPAHRSTAPAHSTAPVVTQVSTGAGTATYAVDLPAYSVTVTTTTGRSWVSLGSVGQRPAFAGILSPNSSQKVILLGPSEVDVGAGGTTVTITADKRSTTLTPPSAPFKYQFQPKKG